MHTDFSSGIQFSGELRLKGGFRKKNQVTKQGIYGILQSLDPTFARQAISHIMFLADVPPSGVFSAPPNVKFSDILPLVAHNSITSIGGPQATVSTVTSEAGLTITIQTVVLSGIDPGVLYNGAALVMNGDVLQGQDTAVYTPNGNEKLLGFLTFEPVEKVMWDDFTATWEIKGTVG